MKKKLVLIFIIILNCSNFTESTLFYIKNDSNNLVTNLIISNGVNEITIDTINMNMNKSIELLFKNVPVIDGGYKISYELNSQKNSKNFGYYSNGHPSGAKYKIDIKKDTLIIKESFNN